MCRLLQSDRDPYSSTDYSLGFIPVGEVAARPGRPAVWFALPVFVTLALVGCAVQSVHDDGADAMSADAQVEFIASGGAGSCACTLVDSAYPVLIEASPERDFDYKELEWD